MACQFAKHPLRQHGIRSRIPRRRLQLKACVATRLLCPSKCKQASIHMCARVRDASGSDYAGLCDCRRWLFKFGQPGQSNVFWLPYQVPARKPQEKGSARHVLTRKARLSPSTLLLWGSLLNQCPRLGRLDCPRWPAPASFLPFWRLVAWAVPVGRLGWAAS